METRIITNTKGYSFNCYFCKFDPLLPKDITDIFYDKDRTMDLNKYLKAGYNKDYTMYARYLFYYLTKDHFDYKDLIYELSRSYQDDRDRSRYLCNMENPLDMTVLVEDGADTSILDLINTNNQIILTPMKDKELFKSMVKMFVYNGGWIAKWQ